MTQWILEHAPDLASAMNAGKVKLTPIYQRLRNQYVMAIAAARMKATAKQNNKITSMAGT
jgi:hypothetical protein